MTLPRPTSSARKRPRHLPRALNGVLLGLCCALVVWIAGATSFLLGIEHNTVDAMFRTRGIMYPSPAIVLIMADDATVATYSWPPRREVWAKLTKRLSDAGARTIAFDVVFAKLSERPQDDLALERATRASGRVVHASVFNLGGDDPTVQNDLPANANKILHRFGIPDSPGFCTEDDSLCSKAVRGSAAMPALQEGAAGLGHVNAPPDEDGVLRSIPNVLRFKGRRKEDLDAPDPVIYPSLALAATAHYLGTPIRDIRVNPRSIILPAEPGEGGPRQIPMDERGRTRVNWIGPHFSYTNYSLTSVLRGEVPDDQFKDKLVLVGVSAAGAYERHATPFSEAQPAVELQANAIDDILMNRSLISAPFWMWNLLMFIWAAAIGALTLTRNTRVSGFLVLICSCVLWGAALLLFTRFHFVLMVALPIMAGFLSWGVNAGFRQYLDAEQLRRAEERFALAVRGANDGLWDWDLATGEVYFSPRWKAMLGVSADETMDSADHWYRLVHPDDLEHMQAQLEAHLKGGSAHFESRHRMRHAEGYWLWVLSRGLRVLDSSGKPSRMAGSQSDISEQVAANEQLEHNAFYDVLTGLPNRALFMDVLSRALARATRRNDYRFAVLFMDLDRFKLVNDSLGHGRGDEFLVHVARRLEHGLRPGDVAARLGGDEFAVLLDDVVDIAAATRIVERIQQELARPFVIGGHELFPTSSIGIALSASTYSQPEDMLRDADTAMYRAKSLGRARHAVFDEAMHAHALSLLRLESDLRHALERHEFQVYYQPIVSLETGRVAGFEALARWPHRTRGLVSPSEFISLAEETGLIVPLDHQVLREACLQLKTWQQMFPAQPLWVSVNLSTKQFAQPDLIERISRTLAETGLPASALKLEITEGVLMNNPESAADMLRQLRDLGLRLSIDDFGTGYSSLSYLHRFPLDTLKVDQSFVARMGEAGENSEIVRTIVMLARSLKMDVVAEGVETATQMALLSELHCEYGQGYFFSRPVEASAAQTFLAQNKVWTATPAPTFVVA